MVGQYPPVGSVRKIQVLCPVFPRSTDGRAQAAGHTSDPMGRERDARQCGQNLSPDNTAEWSSIVGRYFNSEVRDRAQH